METLLGREPSTLFSEDRIALLSAASTKCIHQGSLTGNSGKYSMQIRPYLTFNGNCELAFQAYQKILGGKLQLVEFGDSHKDYHAPTSWRSKVRHGSLTTDDGATLMGWDPPANRFEKPQGFSVSLLQSDFDKANSIFDELSKGGSVAIPFDKTPWAKGFGMCVDEFGITWMVNCE